jgi:hypothetical protein
MAGSAFLMLRSGMDTRGRNLEAIQRDLMAKNVDVNPFTHAQKLPLGKHLGVVKGKP